MGYNAILHQSLLFVNHVEGLPCVMDNHLHMAISGLLSDYQDLMQNKRYHKRLVVAKGDDPYTTPREEWKDNVDVYIKQFVRSI